MSILLIALNTDISKQCQFSVTWIKHVGMYGGPGRHTRNIGELYRKASMSDHKNTIG